jgi:hypothetical protein
VVRIGMARIPVRHIRRLSHRRVACVPDIWSGLTDEQREKLELGNEAMRVLKRARRLNAGIR